MHELWKGFAGHVHYQLLLNRHAAAGIAHLCSRNKIHTNRRGIGRLFTIKNLYQCGHRFIRRVSGETVDR